MRIMGTGWMKKAMPAGWERPGSEKPAEYPHRAGLRVNNQFSPGRMSTVQRCLLAWLARGMGGSEAAEC